MTVSLRITSSAIFLLLRFVLNSTKKSLGEPSRVSGRVRRQATHPTPYGVRLANPEVSRNAVLENSQCLGRSPLSASHYFFKVHVYMLKIPKRWIL
ncbi:MAG: hypothetical protein L0215_09010 [Gemmataceae bacterium]|nr:hypothetical protein [Gemmataceae bacterium]